MKNIKLDISSLTASIILTAFTIIGVIAKDTLINETFTLWNKLGYVKLIAGGMTAILCGYICFKYLFRCMDLLTNKKDNRRGFDSFHCICRKYLIKIIIVLLICWIPYMIIRFPGNLDPDTEWQLLQFFNLCVKSDHHPWFDTLVFGCFWKLGKILGSEMYGLLIYALVQYVLTAFSLALTICYLLFISKKVWLTSLTIIFVALYPVIPLFAQSMMKDSFHGWIWILFLLGLLEIIRTDAEVLKSKYNLICYLFILCLLQLTKKTGIYIWVGTLLLLVVYLRKKSMRVLVLGLVSIGLVAGIWERGILPACGVEKGEAKELLSIPSQQTAAYLKYHTDEITTDEWKLLSEVYNNIETMADAYNPTRADSTKDRWRIDSTAENQITFWKWYIKKFKEEPILFIDAAVANAYALFYPDTVNQGNESFIFYYNNIASSETGNEAMEATLVRWSGGFATQEDVHEMLGTMYRNAKIAMISDQFDRFYLKLAEKIPFLFCKTLFTTYLPILVMCYLLGRKKWSGMMYMVPIWICWLTQFAGPIVLPRYMVTWVYQIPILLSILFLDKSQ